MRLKKMAAGRTINADKKTYKQGDSSVTISQIKKDYFLPKTLTEHDTTQKFTPALTEAVKSYQHTIRI